MNESEGGGGKICFKMRSVVSQTKEMEKGRGRLMVKDLGL